MELISAVFTESMTRAMTSDESPLTGVPEDATVAREGVASQVTPLLEAGSTAVPANNGSGVGSEEAVNTNAELHMRIIYLIIGVVGMCGNGLVAVVIINVRSMRRTFPNMFIINQSMLDFAASFFVITTTFIHDVTWVQGDFGKELFCRLWLTNLPLWGIFVSSTYNLVFLTYERYFAIVHPLMHSRVFTRRKLYRVFAFCWLFGPGFNASYMIPTATMKGDDCTVYSEYPSVTWQQTVGIITVVLQYFIPLALITYAYVRIAYVLKQASKSNNTEMNGAEKKTTEEIKREARLNRARNNIFKTLALVGAAFIFCWSWNQVYFFMFNLGFSIDMSSTFYHFTVVAVFCNCCLNPFIYAFQYEQFQNGLRRLFCKKSSELDDSSVSGTASKYTRTTAIKRGSNTEDSANSSVAT